LERNALQWAVVACGLALVAADASAQTAGTRNAYGTNITVNDDVLNSLDPAGPAPAIPHREGAESSHGFGPVAVHQPGVLLFPPPDFPRSQLVHPGAAGLSFERRTISPAAGQEETPRSGTATQAEAAAVTAEASDSTGITSSAAESPVSETAEPGAASEEAGKALEPSDQAPETEKETAASASQEEPGSASAANTRSADQTGGTEAPSTATMVAAVSPADGAMASVTFLPSSADLSDEGKMQLRALAEKLSADSSARVQIRAYAESDSESPNAARRLSLSRALVVRGFLIDQGLNATRMQVRALGDRFEAGPPDRVDVRPQGG
jgi:outer membrane protein OmpA-like peptidoglycan-associated protein